MIPVLGSAASCSWHAAAPSLGFPLPGFLQPAPAAIPTPNLLLQSLLPQDKSSPDPNRVGGPINPLLSDGGLSTIISGGKGVDSRLANNLARLQTRTEVGSDRVLIAGFNQIKRICGTMKLPDVVRHQANEYYKEVRVMLACAGATATCWLLSTQNYVMQYYVFATRSCMHFPCS